MTKFSAPQQSQLAQIGAFLRDQREKQEKSLEDIAIRTYIRPQLLGGIESGNPEVLPEPIFVQGFIRRYAETLGLNGIELSQQFTVDSIPSTPRPARPAPLSDSPTTRLTRIASSQPTVPQPSPSPVPIISAETALTPDQPAEVEVAAELESGSEKANIPSAEEKVDIPYAEEPALAPPDLSQSAAAPQPSEPAFASSEPTFATIDDVFSTNEISLGETLEPKTVAPKDTHTDVQLQERPSEISPSDLGGEGLNGHSSEKDSLDNDEADPLDGDQPRDSFHLDLEDPPTSSHDSVPDDERTEAFTPTFNPQPATSVMVPAASATESVGVDYDRSKSMNLMPFILGGLAVVAAGAAILFGLFGGERQPGIANRPEAVEQTTDSAPPDALTEVPTPSPDEAVSAQPPISTAPVYVEAIATSEAWVSIIADGNPTPIFEGTLLPGESQVWEAQEELSIWSGDPGALQLSANGAEATVMGEPGLPAEKIFP